MLTDGTNRRIELGRQIGSRGGEGCVYEIIGQPQLVAKKYHSPPDKKKQEKLFTQIAAANSHFQKFAAWPSDILSQNGAPIGFLMPRALGKAVHLLYRPVDRREHFPGATWQDLINVSRNIAAAFHALHARKVLMADINESNILITSRGEVRLIDCDSFQISSPCGTVYPCEVGVGFWTPPELQGKSFENLIRTEQHDAFGLAVLIFHILFMGKHPFAGVPLSAGLLENPPSLEDCIRRHQFAHTRRGRIEFKSPPFSLPLSSLPESVANLFEQAFLSTERPSAALWHRELSEIQFQKCQWGHTFYRRLTECPWCAIWNSGGPNFFIAAATIDTSGTSAGEIEGLMEEIRRAAIPLLEKETIQQLSSFAPIFFLVPAIDELRIPVLQPTPFPALSRTRPGYIGGWVLLAISIALGVALPAALLVWFVLGLYAVVSIAAGSENPDFAREVNRRKSRPAEIYAQIQKQLAEMEKSKEQLLQKFVHSRGQFSADIQAKQAAAEKAFKIERDQFQEDGYHLLKRYREIPLQRKALRQHRMEITQKGDYLRNFRLSGHKIPQIGPARSNILATFGIVTAWDVKNMGYVPKLGQGDAELRAWVTRLENRFRFNPASPLSAAGEQELRRDIQKLENDVLNDFRTLRERWKRRRQATDPNRLRTLRDAKIAEYTAELAKQNHLAEENHRKSEAELSLLLKEYAQATVDSKVLA